MVTLLYFRLKNGRHIRERVFFMKKNKYTEDYERIFMDEDVKSDAGDDAHQNTDNKEHNIDGELFHDGLFFAEKAKNEQDEHLVKQRYQRAAVVSFASAFEAFLNRNIFELLGRNSQVRDQIKSGHKIFHYLNGAEKPTPERLATVTTKIILLEEICNAIVTQKNAKAKHKNANNKQAKIKLINEKSYLLAFESFQEVLLLRDKLIHNSHSRFKETEKRKLEQVSSEAAGRYVKLINSICRLLKIEIPLYLLFWD
jgi:hypothetical protein